MATKDKVTPMMRQYLAIRRELPADVLLLFRLGDFYEMFGSDAERGAAAMDITLTKRGGQPMAGVPYHAADTYIQRALERGLKVALADQVEAPQPGKLVERRLARILTPGTTLESHQLDARRNRYLLALDDGGRDGLHASWLDLSTGHFEVACESRPTELLSVFHALDPKEILLPEGLREQWSAAGDPHAHPAPWPVEVLAFLQDRAVTELPGYQFDTREGLAVVKDALGVLTLDGFGLDGTERAIGTAGALVEYATVNLCERPKNLHRLVPYRSTAALLLDPATQRNLEIFKSSRGTREGSLLATLDGTVTAGGARLLERSLSAPSRDRAELERRHGIVEAFRQAPGTASELQEHLRGVRDIPRILGRLQNRLRNPRELGGLRETLRTLPHVAATLESFGEPALEPLQSRLHAFPELAALLEKAFAEELPGNIAEGGVMATGYDKELDRLRALTKEGRGWVSELEAAEQGRTGIRSLKVKFNNAFGYFIEITKAHLSKVPEDYIRKSSTVNAERFVTEDLKSKEKEILHADEKAKAREEVLFREICEQVLEYADELRETATVLAEVDLFCGWAQLARRWGWCRPALDDSLAFEITEGRHPVIEAQMEKTPGGLGGSERFVPNDTVMDGSGDQVLLLTGPNMAGKSTYIRQVALIALMAQIGCPVPAKACRLGLVDRIFSRVGASDELARGNSTFMVEMNETANILNHATEKSLVILDEIGRGTSTYDGLSIAWAVAEHLHGEAGSGPRTLFATHYHELTRLAETLPRLRCYTVAVKEWNERIHFLRQVVPGAADKSYGIQVARLAGLPPAVIERAKGILETLESGTFAQEGERVDPAEKPTKKRPKSSSSTPSSDDQLGLF